ncbi:unnamed protein product [Scytosiphon promiscuus]
MDMKEKDLEDIFYKYGKITDMQLKMPERPPAFGFVTFEDSRDADEAVRARDGYDFDGHRLRVEMMRFAALILGGGGRAGHKKKGERDGQKKACGGPRLSGWGDGNHGGRGGHQHDTDGHALPRFDDGGSRQTEFRAVVTGLPQSASWQDLKDHMRKAGDVCYADVDNKGGGVVHFNNREGMDYALRKLDGSEFSNRYDSATISVLPHRDSVRDSRSRSRSPPRRERSRDRRRSRSRSPPPRDSYRSGDSHRGRSRSRSR